MNTASQQADQWLRYALISLCSLIGILQWQAVLERNDPELLATTLLVCLSIGSLLWDKRRSLTLRSSWGSSLLGGGIIFLILLRSLMPSGYQPRLSLLIIGFGLSLLASGSAGWKTYWRELTITGLLITDPILAALLQSIDLPQITASFSATALSLLGFQTEQQGALILLPTGRVEVYGACSGIGSIIQMFNLSIVLALILPAKLWVKQVSFLLAPILGFSINALRIALLTFLISQANITAFN